MSEPNSLPFDPGQMRAVRTIAMVALNVVPFGLFFLRGLLSPGRKGYMRTQREVFHDKAPLHEVFQTYLERVRFEGFEPVEGQVHPPRQIVAQRTPEREPATFTHASIPLELKISFAERDQGVDVQVEMKTRSFVVLDTGEGRYIDETLKRLLEAELAQEQRPIVPNVTLTAVIALYIGILMLIAPLLMLVPGFGLGRALGLLEAMGMECFVCVGLSLIALYLCYRNPGEITGRLRALIAIGVSIFAFAYSVGLFALVHGPALLAHLGK